MNEVLTLNNSPEKAFIDHIIMLGLPKERYPSHPSHQEAAVSQD